MKIERSKGAIDLGIVVEELDRSVAFYRDLLGFDDEGTVELPGGLTMHRLRCGDSVVKLLAGPQPPAARAAGGGPAGATGYRYWTICVSNVKEIFDALQAAGCRIPMPLTEIRPGVQIVMAEDPDGNWVEFAQYPEAP